NNSGRVMNVSPGKKVEISDLTITGGRENEGVAMVDNGDLTMRRCRVTGNTVVTGDIVLGGIIRVPTGGKVSMEDCTVANNVTGFGGGVFLGSGTGTPAEGTFA